MNIKQKKMLIRIIISSVLMILLFFAYRILGPADKPYSLGLIKEPFWFILYMIPYIIIGFSIAVGSKATPESMITAFSVSPSDRMRTSMSPSCPAGYA